MRYVLTVANTAMVGVAAYMDSKGCAVKVTTISVSEIATVFVQY